MVSRVCLRVGLNEWFVCLRCRYRTEWIPYQAKTRKQPIYVLMYTWLNTTYQQQRLLHSYMYQLCKHNRLPQQQLQSPNWLAAAAYFHRRRAGSLTNNELYATTSKTTMGCLTLILYAVVV